MSSDQYLRPFDEELSTFYTVNRPNDHGYISTRPSYLSPTSFDQIPQSNIDKELNINKRISNIDYYFDILHIRGEDCRQKVLCEVIRDPSYFSPLSEMFSQEMR